MAGIGYEKYRAAAGREGHAPRVLKINAARIAASGDG
jgi:hypothetical protein